MTQTNRTTYCPYTDREVPESATSNAPRKPLGQWLIENVPRGTNLEIPSRHEPHRAIPFNDGDEERG